MIFSLCLRAISVVLTVGFDSVRRDLCALLRLLRHSEDGQEASDGRKNRGALARRRLLTMRRKAEITRMMVRARAPFLYVHIART